MDATRFRFIRWSAAYGAFGFPQAAAPIAFALVALPLTGSADSGAALVLTMTAAQFLGSAPLARLGDGWCLVSYLRTLLVARSVALMSMVVLAALGTPFWTLLLAAGASGVVNGAIYGYLRVLLSSLVHTSRLPRALGIAATLNEVTFAVAPVTASALGLVAPALALAALAIVGTAPLFLVPTISQTSSYEPSSASGARLTPTIMTWFYCAAACAGAVTGVEVGAVSLAVNFGLNPSWGFIFALVLCLSSISGGIFVSIRNSPARMPEVVSWLALTAAGAALVAAGLSVAVALIGAVAIGFFVPLLGTHFSLVLEQLAPPEARPVIFALLKTASSLGIVLTSGLLAFGGLTVALTGTVILTIIATVLALFSSPQEDV